MFLRNLLRRPVRTVLTILGLSTSVMIMVLGLFMTDMMDAMLGTQFELLNRESMTVSFLRPVSATALGELKSRRRAARRRLSAGSRAPALWAVHQRARNYGFAARRAAAARRR